MRAWAPHGLDDVAADRVPNELADGELELLRGRHEPLVLAGRHAEIQAVDSLLCLAVVSPPVIGTAIVQDLYGRALSGSLYR